MRNREQLYAVVACEKYIQSHRIISYHFTKNKIRSKDNKIYIKKIQWEGEKQGCACMNITHFRKKKILSPIF